MRIKTFEAATMQEALARVKQELGENAVVLNTRYIKGDGSIGQAGRVELMAAVDDVAPAVRQPSAAVHDVVYTNTARYAQPQPVHQQIQPVFNQPKVMGYNAEPQQPARMPEPQSVVMARQPQTLPDPSERVGQGLFTKVYGNASRGQNVSAVLENNQTAVQQRVQEINSASSQEPLSAQVIGKAKEILSSQDNDIKQLKAEIEQMGAIIKQIAETQIENKKACEHIPLLIKLGVDEEIAKNMLEDVMCIEDPEALACALTGKLQSFAAVPTFNSHEVHVVVGPTGVGKTTTLAKMAARYVLEYGRSVALVTADTYRIGAVEQLRTYAKIMGVPLEVGLSPDEVRAGVEKHRDKNVVLVDTVGRSQRSEEQLRELLTFVQAAQPTHTHLVVAASHSDEIQSEVLEKFSIFSPNRLAITKLDESIKRGCIINLPFKTGTAVSCLTAGQNVPQDIEFADASRMARWFTGVQV
ncbi:MAG: flagellar biosynthesis protein FlhF [Armatimonadota bacterium]